DRPVADGVDMHLEACCVEPCHARPELLRVDIGQSAVAGLATAGIEVWLDHGGREILRDPVLHDLHRVRPEPPRLAVFPPAPDLRELLDAAVAVPPQGALDPP